MEKTTNEDIEVVIIGVNPPVCVIAEVVGNAVDQWKTGDEAASAASYRESERLCSFILVYSFLTEIMKIH